jgi:hypothetical protein
MLILIPWKPVVILWCLLAAMLWVGYIGYSVLEGKNPFAMAQHHSYRFRPAAPLTTELPAKAIRTRGEDSVKGLD